MIKAIDYWVNPFTADLMKRMVMDIPELPSAKRSMAEQYPSYTVEEWVRYMDENDVEKCFIPSWKMYSYLHKHYDWNFSVEEIAELVAQAPDRLAGLYGIDPFARMDGVRAMERAVKEFGFIGAHCHPFGFGLPVNAPDFYPFYAKCVELNVPVVFQAGHAAEFAPDRFSRPEQYEEIVLYFPELRVVAAHTGWPWTEEFILLATLYPNLYIGCTSWPPSRWSPSLVRFLNSGRGIGKVMWGTDWPVVEIKRSRREVEAMNLREEVKVALYRETAVKVFKL